MSRTSHLSKVLVVEDEALIRFNISDHLAHTGHEALEATNAAEAFEILESEQDVGAIITHIEMPGPVDGLMLAKFATERWPHRRVIAISSHQEAEATDLPDGTAFLSKPCGLEDISRKMTEFGYGQSPESDDKESGS